VPAARARARPHSAQPLSTAAYEARVDVMTALQARYPAAPARMGL